MFSRRTKPNRAVFCARTLDEGVRDIVSASFSKTVEFEVLGSGDASLADQWFILRHKPFDSTVKVCVDGERWNRVASLSTAGPEDAVYRSHQDDAGNSVVKFGDGINGRRLPTGVDNVTASYRVGGGSSGRVTVLATVFFVLLAALVLLSLGRDRPWESPTNRAYRLCDECGLDRAEIDQLIDDIRYSTLTREGNLELFYDTFDDRGDAELCLPCADAVLDAGED